MSQHPHSKSTVTTLGRTWIGILAASAGVAGAARADAVIGTTSFPTIQAAINSTLPGPITVNPGTYFENLSINETVTISANGTVSIVGTVSISGFAPTLVGLNFSPFLVGTTGMSIIDSNTTVQSCTFTNYQAGAVRIANTALIPAPLSTFTDCTFTSNTAFLGGAIFVKAETFTQTASDLRLLRCVFQSNGSVPDSDGVDTVFGGGAVYLGDKSSGDVQNCQFLQNTSGGWGGAIMAEFTDSLTILHSLIQANTCEEAGGGVYVSPVVQLIIRDTVFADNAAVNSNGFATSGGGLFAATADGGAADIFNCLFVRNSARAGGGVTLADIVANIGQCTFTQNFASWTGGGLILTDTFTTIGNSILWGNGSGVFPANATWTAEINFAAPSGPSSGAPVVNFCDIGGSSQPTWLPALGSTGPNLDADPSFQAGLYSCTFTPPSVSGFFLRSTGPCVNAGAPFIPFSGSNWRCTQRAGALPGDVGTADLGFHYPDTSCP